MSTGVSTDHQLSPGELLVFEDILFNHGATRLEPLPGGTAQRDMIVFTVDYDPGPTWRRGRTARARPVRAAAARPASRAMIMPGCHAVFFGLRESTAGWALLMGTARPHSLTCPNGVARPSAHPGPRYRRLAGPAQAPGRRLNR